MAGFVALSLAFSGCAVSTEETTDRDPSAEDARGEGPETGEAQEAANPQDIPVTLPHAGPFSISHGKALLGHPFAVKAGAMVTISAEARWANPTCHSPYTVNLRDAGFLGGALRPYAYPTGTIHTEHWKVPSAGMYRLDITIQDQPACLPLQGQATITSP
jgi:hypothetical protein